MTNEEKIKRIIDRNNERIKLRWPKVKNIELTYKINKSGQYLSVLKAKIKKNIVIASSENFSLIQAIKKSFVKFDKLIGKQNGTRRKKQTLKFHKEAS